jgi:hypothetical protein
MTAWPIYRVRTRNPSAHSENRMHSDDVARSFGFRAALVPGVTVFAHMTHPLVERFGEAWLARGSAEVKLAQPAYDGDLLSVETVEDSAGGEFQLSVVCRNAEGAELARLATAPPGEAGSPDSRSLIPPAPPVAERPLVTWDLMEVGKPFPALAWRPTQAENLQWCAALSDDLPLYREGDAPLLHPGFVLRQANMVLRNRFRLPAWIHTSSSIAFHHALRAGQPYEVRAIPEEKWNRKGHEFVRLYVAILGASEVVAEVVHTAIFHPRAAGEEATRVHAVNKEA